MDQWLKIDNNKECVSSGTRVGLTVSGIVISQKEGVIRHDRDKERSKHRT